MLNVAFFELVRGVKQNLLAGDVRFGVNERHHILQLIAETERAARLIKRRTRPHAADERLIQKPAIDDGIQVPRRAFALSIAPSNSSQ